MTTKEKLAYLAGLIDGEGNIRVEKTCNKKRDNVHYNGRLTVANTDERMVSWLKENYGGFIWKRDWSKTKTKGVKPNWKDVYMWIKMLNTPSLQFVKDVIPYMIVKKDRMKLILEFLETKSTNGKSITRKTANKRDKIIKRFTQLNKKGI